MNTDILLILILIGIIGAIIMIKGVFKSDATISASAAKQNGKELLAAILDRSIEGVYNNSEITSIGNYAFCRCSSLTSIDLPNVTSIGIDAFFNCSSLTSIDLPNVTSIGDWAFSSCTLLTSIDLPNVTSIGDWAFRSCTLLTSIDLPKVTSIGSNAFYGCSKLTAIHFSATNKSKIEANSYYSSKWGATNATIYFDL